VLTGAPCVYGDGNLPAKKLWLRKTRHANRAAGAQATHKVRREKKWQREDKTAERRRVAVMARSSWTFQTHANEEVILFEDLPEIDENFPKTLEEFKDGLDGKIAHLDENRKSRAGMGQDEKQQPLMIGSAHEFKTRSQKHRRLVHSSCPRVRRQQGLDGS